MNETSDFQRLTSTPAANATIFHLGFIIFNGNTSSGLQVGVPKQPLLSRRETRTSRFQLPRMWGQM